MQSKRPGIRKIALAALLLLLLLLLYVLSRMVIFLDKNPQSFSKPIPKLPEQY